MIVTDLAPTSSLLMMVVMTGTRASRRGDLRPVERRA